MARDSVSFTPINLAFRSLIRTFAGRNGKEGMKLYSDAALAKILDKDVFHLIGDVADTMGMEFYEDGDYIVSKWHPEKNYQGWVNTMHGGILSTLIDEVCGWVVTRKLQTSGNTVFYLFFYKITIFF